MGLSHQNEDQVEEDRNDDVASNYDEYENAEGVDYHASYYDMGLDDATVKVREKNESECMLLRHFFHIRRTPNSLAT